MTPTPLRFMRVLDLSQYIAGSACSQALADFGATVTKVEPFAGDPARALGLTRFGSTYFRQYNTGKESVAIDFDDAEDRERLDMMLSESDAVVMNFSPRTLVKHSLDWDALHARYPALIVVLISAYGDGDARTAFDSIAQSVSGFGYLNADEFGAPRISAGYPTDVFSGLFAAMSAAMAFLDDARTGGMLVDVPMVEVAMSALCGPALLACAEEGVVPHGSGNRDAATAPSNTYPCADGYAYIYAGLDKHWEILRTVIDGEAASREARLADPARFDAMLSSWTEHRDVVDVCQKMTELGIAAGPVSDPLTALEEVQRHRPGAVVSTSGEGEAVPQFPVYFNGGRILRTAAPNSPRAKDGQ